MSGRKKYCPVASPRSDQGKFVGSCGTKSGPGPHGRHLRQTRHVFLRTLQHAHEHEVVYFFMLRTVLARRSDQNLAGAPRLHVERNRITADGVSTLQIAEFHQLMPYESGIAVGNDQMSLPLLDLKSRRKLRSGGSGCVHGDFGGDLGAVCETNLPLAD